MATYVPKNYKEVEAIQLPLVYNKHHLDMISKWLDKNFPGEKLSGWSEDGVFYFSVSVSRGWERLVLAPSDYIFIDPNTGRLRLSKGSDFEEEFSLKFDGSSIVSGAISAESLKPPTGIFGVR